jgi:hypothetical protein
MFRVLVLGIDLNVSYFYRSFSRQPQSINQVVCGSNTQGEQIESWIGVPRSHALAVEAFGNGFKVNSSTIVQQ